MSKETRLNIRVKPDFKADLEAIAEFHGLTVTSYVHSVLVRKIREEKEREPEAFENINGKELATKSKNKMPFRKSVEDTQEKAA